MKLKRITSLIHSAVYHERCTFILKGQLRQPVLSFLLFLRAFCKRNIRQICTCAGSLSSKDSKTSSSTALFTGSTSRTYLASTRQRCHPRRTTLPARPATDLNAHWEAAVIWLPLRSFLSPSLRLLQPAGVTGHVQQK